MEKPTVSIVKENGVKVMVSVEAGVSLDCLLEMVHRAILGAGFCPEGALEYVEEES